MSKKISDSTIKRLTLYYYFLTTKKDNTDIVISSQELAQSIGVTDAQVRKDLKYFGSFGKRGTGYNIKHLCEKLSNILGVKKVIEVALVGVGNLGKALMSYRGFEEYGYKIKYIFDSDHQKIGKKIMGYTCFNTFAIPEVVKKNKINMAIMSVPKDSAQNVAEKLINSGVRAILNFAPCKIIHDSSKVKVINVDVASELKALSYYLLSNK